MINKQSLLLQAITHSYAAITVNETEQQYRNRIWYKQAVEVDKYFNKKKPILMKEANRNLLEKVFNRIKELDAIYFEDKEFSAYVCMILGINYLLNEIRDTSIRTKFGHWDTTLILSEVETTDGLKGVGSSSYKYFDKVLDVLEELK